MSPKEIRLPPAENQCRAHRSRCSRGWGKEEASKGQNGLLSWKRCPHSWSPQMSGRCGSEGVEGAGKGLLDLCSLQDLGSDMPWNAMEMTMPWKWPCHQARQSTSSSLHQQLWDRHCQTGQNSDPKSWWVREAISVHPLNPEGMTHLWLCFIIITPLRTAPPRGLSMAAGEAHFLLSGELWAVQWINLSFGRWHLNLINNS